MRELLDVEQLVVCYGDSVALNGVSLRVYEGEVVCVLGRNGAGKSTLLNAIMGLVQPTTGRIRLLGKDVAGLQTYRRVRAGLSLVPEGRRLFSSLAVVQNLALGGYRLKNSRSKLAMEVQGILELFPNLLDRPKQRADTLSGGEQQMLAIGRSLMSHPRLLLLDELSQGLAPIVVRELFTVLHRLNESGMTIVLAEQNAVAALNLAHRCIALETGRVAFEGSAEEAKASERVFESYLGTG